MARNDLFNLLNSVDKGVGRTYGANGTLSRLFRQILRDRKVGPEKFGALMHDYLDDPRNRVSNNRKDRTSARGNLGMALAQPKMTWKVFCKGLRFLKVVKIDIAIRAYYANGQEEIHQTSMVLAEQTAAEKAEAGTTNQPHTDGKANEDTGNDEQ